MRKISEIRSDLSAKVAEVKNLDQSNLEAVNRGVEELNALSVELENANAIEAAEQRLARKKIEAIQDNAGRNFSFVKMVRELSEGRDLTGVEAEVADLGAQEYKRQGLIAEGTVVPAAMLRAASGQSYGSATNGAALVETSAPKYVDMLKDHLAVASLGATIYGDLVGNVPVVNSKQIAASWAAEGAAASVTKAIYGKGTLVPRRIMACLATTRDLIRQTSFDVEADLINKLVVAHANKLEEAAIAGTGSSQPTGILNATTNVVALGTNGGALTWKAIVELEQLINEKGGNRGNMGYLFGAKSWADAKSVQKGNGIGFILDAAFGNVVNGYRAEFSSLMPKNLVKGTASTCTGVIFGNFADLYIGQWGGLDIIVDPYSAKKTGEIEIMLNAYSDVLVAEADSFAVIKDVL